MAEQVDFAPGTVVSSNFLNDQQQAHSALHIGVRLERASATQIQLTPLGDGSSAGAQSSIIINGQPRWWTSPIVKTVSGGAGIYGIYVTAGEESVLTSANLTLTTGAAPANSRKIGEVVWSGTAIESIEQVLGGVTGAMIEEGAWGTEGSLEWSREPSGAWVPQIRNGAITSPMLDLNAGTITGSGSLTKLTGSFEDVAGTEFKIIPTVAGVLRVTAVFWFELSGPSGLDIQAIGTISLDGTAQNEWAVLGTIAQTTGLGADSIGTAVQVYDLSLTAASHTLWMQAKAEEVGGGETGSAYVNPTRSRYSYLLL